MTNDDDAATVEARPACLADLPVPVLALVLGAVGVRDGLRAAAAAECLRDGLVNHVRAGITHVPWRTALRKAVAHECAFAFDPRDDSMTRRAGGDWLRCWQGDLDCQDRVARFGFYRNATVWVNGDDALAIAWERRSRLIHYPGADRGVHPAATLPKRLRDGTSPLVVLVVNESEEELDWLSPQAMEAFQATWDAGRELTLDQVPFGPPRCLYINDLREYFRYWQDRHGQTRGCFELERNCDATDLTTPRIFLAPFNDVHDEWHTLHCHLCLHGSAATDTVVGLIYPPDVELAMPNDQGSGLSTPGLDGLSQLTFELPLKLRLSMLTRDERAVRAASRFGKWDYRTHSYGGLTRQQRAMLGNFDDRRHGFCR